MPDVVPYELPTGKVVRICEECAMDPARHQYFCSAVRSYSRAQVLREMVRVADEILRLDAVISELGGDAQLERDMLAAYGLDGTSGTNERTVIMRAQGSRMLLRLEFWDWAWWIGIELATSSREERAAVRRAVEKERTKEVIPPWKRRRTRAAGGTLP